ncbi:uncharacterized protein LOC127425270 [Myxocyprinus asiaticus]|uniref:uncharacterized protein LOC127425270 n=1 Tax=Myxocyprinus asiaticus TaxID=70543 RepID=UPI0022226EBC|nr:uncharacterized protein LOC127425270 [Myxocyprinus asiaticus]
MELQIIEEATNSTPVSRSTVLYTTSTTSESSGLTLKKNHSEKLLEVSSAKGTKAKTSEPRKTPISSPELSVKSSSLQMSGLNKHADKLPNTISLVANTSSPVSVAKSPSPPGVIKSSSRIVDVKSSSPVTIAKSPSPVIVRKNPSHKKVPKSSSPVTATKSLVLGDSAKSPSSEAGITSKSPVPTPMPLPAPPVSKLTLTPKPSKEKLDNSESGILGISLPCPEPLLEEALDKLLVSSLSQPEPIKRVPLTMVEGSSPKCDQQRLITEDLALLGRSTPQDGCEGTVMPVTEAGWMDDSLNSALFFGMSDVSLHLPVLQPSAVERLSASGQLKSVIRRTKETSNVHPMFRDGHMRRKMGPIVLNKSTSQDRLIKELQGKLGIGRTQLEHPHKQPDDWLTEGVIVCSNPQRSREEHGVSPTVDKIIIPPESPSPTKKVLTHPVPKKPEPSTLPPPPPPPKEPTPPPPPQRSPSLPPPPKYPDPPPIPPSPPKAVTPPPPPKVWASVGCQTEYEPLFPPVQA